jgi:hypothetical protein
MMYRPQDRQYRGPTGPYSKALRDNGEQWPAVAHTMVGSARLLHTQYALQVRSCQLK